MPRWKTRNSSTAAELLIEFFEFYALGFRASELVVSLRQTGGISKEEKQWKGKKLSIEDPFSTKRPLTRSVNNLSVLDYIADCFKIAYLYFGTVQTRNGPVITKIAVPDSASSGGSSPATTPDEGGKEVAAEAAVVPAPAPRAGQGQGQVHDLLKQLTVNDGENVTPGAAGIHLPAGAMTLEELEKSFSMDDSGNGESEAATSEGGVVLPGAEETFESLMKKFGHELTPRQAQQVTDLVPKNMILFQFDGSILTAGQVSSRYTYIYKL